MSILITVVVEEDGRTTEVSHIQGPIADTARTIARKIDNRDEGKKSFEDQG